MRKLMGCLLVIGLVVSLVLTGCAPAPTPKEEVLPPSLEIGTGSVGGGYYVYGTALAQVLEEEFGIPVSAAPTEGSAENIRLLDRKEIDMAGIATNTAYPAYRGMLAWEKKMDFLRALVGIYEHPSPYVTLAGTGVKVFDDLKGKRVGVGAGKATWEPIAKAIFECEGIGLDEITPVYAGAGDLATQLKDGLIVAMSTFAYPGGIMAVPAISELVGIRTDVVFVKHDVEKIKNIADYAEWMSPTVIYPGAPGITKENWPEGLPCVNIGGPAIMVRADMGEDLAYLLTKTIYENLGKLAEITPYWGIPSGDPENLIRTRGVPYHPGAIKFLKEVGVWKE